MLYGTKHQVSTYVDKDVYDFLTREKGLAAMSVYIRELLTAYKSAAEQNDEQNNQETKENKLSEKMMN